MLSFIYLLNVTQVDILVFIWFKLIYLCINTPLTTLFCPLYLFIEFIYPFLYHFAFPALFMSG